MTAALEKIRRFTLSEVYSIVVFLLAYGLVAFGQPVAAICAMMVVLILVCTLCEDILPMLLPLLLLFCVSMLTTSRVASFDWLLSLFVPPAAAALIYRFIRGVRALRIGPGFYGLVAVSVALLLGGLGSITAQEYFSVGALYHVLGLGPIMLALYLFLKSNVAVRRDYDVGDKIAAAMYLCTVFIAFLVLRIFLVHPNVLTGDLPLADKIVEYAIWRNTAATLTVMGIPFLFYYARRHHAVHLISVVFVYVAIVLSGSRGALICGALEILLCLCYYVFARPRTRRLTLLVLSVLVLLAVLFRAQILAFCEDYLRISFDADAMQNEARYRFLLRAIEDFLACPLFGRGIGYTGNFDIYVPFETTWQVCWYHSLLPQIIGSLGILGILAFGYQLYLRVRVILTLRRTAYTGALVLSYLGVLIYSQIDPGLFSPFPFAALTVLLFVLMEARTVRPVPPLPACRGRSPRQTT